MTLTNFQLVLINGEVVQQDIGYNSMTGQLESENWFYFGESKSEYDRIIESYAEACRRLTDIQKENSNVHLLGERVEDESYSVMCIPAKSILCIRKINPYDDNEHLQREDESHFNTEEHEFTPLSDELRRFSRNRNQSLGIQEEEEEEQRQPRRTNRFERRRRPVIRKRETKNDS